MSTSPADMIIHRRGLDQLIFLILIDTSQCSQSLPICLTAVTCENYNSVAPNISPPEDVTIMKVFNFDLKIEVVDN